jgi:hypothetical protein
MVDWATLFVGLNNPRAMLFVAMSAITILCTTITMVKKIWNHIEQIAQNVLQYTNSEFFF